MGHHLVIPKLAWRLVSMAPGHSVRTSLHLRLKPGVHGPQSELKVLLQMQLRAVTQQQGRLERYLKPPQPQMHAPSCAGVSRASLAQKARGRLASERPRHRQHGAATVCDA